MMTRITLMLLLQMTCSFIVNAQQGFYKVFQEDDYHSMRDMIAIDQNHFAFITSSFFYRIDGSGNILLKKELKHGYSTYPESLIRDGEGNFWIALLSFDSQILPSKVLYKIAPDGRVLKVVDFGVSNSVENMKMTGLPDNSFFFSYQDRGESGNYAVRVLLIDKTGNTIWNKQVTDTIFNRYVIRKGLNNTIDLYYELQPDHRRQITSIDAAGNISGNPVTLSNPGDYHNINDFVRTNDGFVVCGVENKAAPLLTDGFIYKTDNNGNIVWQKTLDIKLSDNFYSMEETKDGYIILCLSGYRSLVSDGEGDIVLLKTDKQGNKIWSRAFGSTKADFARYLRMTNQYIAFAGQSSYPGVSVSTPFVCKTDMNGEIAGTIPFEPVPYTKNKIIETPVQQYASVIVQSAQGPNASVISGGNYLKPGEDQTYPFITRSDKNAKQVWFKQLSDHPARLTVLKEVRPNEYIAVVEIKDIFSNVYDVYKLDATGKVIWTKPVRANAILDVIATHDGGIILTGTFDISFINFETIIIKLDADGNELWNKTIGDLRIWETGRKIIETPEQDFLIVGNAQTEFDLLSSVYLLKIDRQGNRLWTKTFTDGLTTDIGYDVIITEQQGYLITGTSNKQPFTNKDLLLIRTDKNGNLLWRKKHDIHLMDEGSRITNSAGGGFLISGTTAEPPAGQLQKFIYVMKTDGEGRNEGIRYYGQSGVQTMHPSVTILTTGDTVITGTMQPEYGRETLFMTTLEDFIAGTPQENSSLKLYPNPSTGISSLVLNSPQTGDLSVGIYDQNGRQIRQVNRTKTSALPFKEDLDLSTLPSGTYFVSVWFNGKRDNIKWLIIR